MRLGKMDVMSLDIMVWTTTGLGTRVIGNEERQNSPVKNLGHFSPTRTHTLKTTYQ